MSVTIRSFVAAAANTGAAVAELDRELAAIETDPQLAFVFYSHVHDDAAIRGFLQRRFPSTALVGGTSSRGVISDRGVAGDTSVGLLLVTDPDGQYGVAGCELGADPAASAERTLHAALAGADAAGELPELVWVFQAPGREESVMAGLRRVVGDRCPIIGGSAVDDDLAGHWRQLTTGGMTTDGLALAVLFPSGGLSYSYQGGYEPTGDSGIVTEIAPDTPGVSPDEAGISRHIVSIDGEPAAEVYQRWLGGVIDEEVMTRGGSVIDHSLSRPLGVATNSQDVVVSPFRLTQPREVTPAGVVTTFAAVSTGTRVHAMRGAREQLVRRGARTVAAAAAGLGSRPADIAGGLVIYCAGCRAIVGETGSLAVSVGQAFAGQPFVGCFTSGEQGPIPDPLSRPGQGRSVHANLMISAVVFGQ